MKILNIGSSGMLGSDMMKAFLGSSFQIEGCSRSELDITDRHSVQKYINRSRPDCVLLTAAFTRVDDCESHSELAFAVNSKGTENVAMACKEFQAKLVYFSTDYVFDGLQTEPYGEDDPTHPINVYGTSKLAGENYVREWLSNYLIVRTSWLFGRDGRNFVETIMEKARRNHPLDVVDDQKGAPTYTKDLAGAVVSLVKKNIQGIINVTNDGYCSWYEFAEAVLKKAGIMGYPLKATSSETFEAPAKRPKNSRLAHHRLESIFGKPLRLWTEALDSYLENSGT